ncbi:MAG: glycosyltransferase family 39 protein [Verrucomicrobiae bacterium]|nr:glycosyltransferase family 39 protein [Verrucomicrobiae bacterium]
MKQYWPLLILVLALALAVRLFQLGERVLWFDEAVSVLLAKARVAEMLAAIPDDAHPPLYYLLLHLWPRGEPAARMFSVVCGILTVALVFLIGCRPIGHRSTASPARGKTQKAGAGSTQLQPLAGVVSAALLAVCPLHVWYSQEVRMYALQTLLVTASWWLLMLALELRCWRCWTAHAMASALALYTQYTSALALAAQAIYLLWLRGESLRPWLWAQIGVALLFAPCVPVVSRQLGGETFGFWLGKFSWVDVPRFFALLSGAIQKNPGPYWPWAMISLGVLAVAGGRLRWNCAPLLLWFLVPVFLLAAVSLRANMFLPRTLVMVTPAFVLLVGRTAADCRGVVLAIVLAAANLFALQRYFFAPNVWIRSPLREAAELVSGAVCDGDVVLHSSRFSYRPFQCYLGGTVPQGLVRPDPGMPLLGRVIGNGQLPNRKWQRIWLVLWPDFQQPGFHHRVLAEFNARYPKHREVFLAPQLLVVLYKVR